MCAILVCHFRVLKHLSVCTGKIQRQHQTDYPHSRSQHLDSWILLRECFEKAIFSPILFFNVLHSWSGTHQTVIMQNKKGCGGNKIYKVNWKIQWITFLLTWKMRSTKLHCGILNQNVLQRLQVSLRCPSLGDRLPLYTLLSAFPSAHAANCLHKCLYSFTRDDQTIFKAFLLLLCSSPSKYTMEVRLH